MRQWELVVGIGCIVLVAGWWWAPSNGPMPSSTPSPEQPQPAELPRHSAPDDAEQSKVESLVQAEDAVSQQESAASSSADSGPVDNDIPIIDRDAYRQHIDLVANVEVAVPFTPDADHSTIVPSEPVTAFSLHKHRGRTPSLPEIRLVGTGEYRGNAAGVVSELIAVEAVPGAIVTFHCPFLGSFANGADTIAVQADPQGLARVAFRCGRDAGRYPIHAVSPSCRGMATVEVEADVDLATSRKLAASLPRKHRPQTEPPD